MVDVRNGKLVFHFGNFLIQSANDEKFQLLLGCGTILASVKGKNDVALNIA